MKTGIWTDVNNQQTDEPILSLNISIDFYRLPGVVGEPVLSADNQVDAIYLWNTDDYCELDIDPQPYHSRNGRNIEIIIRLNYY